jgi:DNA-binding cell septation regulator SpoVG
MDITIRAKTVSESKDATRGLAYLDLGDSLRVRNIRILEGKNGLFVGMPSVSLNRVDENGQPVYTNIFNTTTPKAKEELTKAVLESYETGKEVTISTEDKSNDITAQVVPVYNGKPGTLGIGRLYINDSFVVSSIVIRNSEKTGEFVSFPSYRTNELDEQGKPVYKEFVYPKDRDAKDKISAIIMEAYKESKELASADIGHDVTDDIIEPLKDENSKGIKEKLMDGEAKKKATKSSSHSKKKEAQIE